jgi:hypothetical protein
VHFAFDTVYVVLDYEGIHLLQNKQVGGLHNAKTYSTAHKGAST